VAAGIVGHSGQGTRISYCSNEGDITLLNDHSHPYRASTIYADQAAGIVAYISNSDEVIDHCWNSGRVTGPGTVAGITGMASAYNAVVSNCLNVGEIVTDSTTSTSYYGAGGVSARGNLQLQNCVNAGDVTGNKYVAGLLGYNASSTSSAAGTAVKQSYTVGKIGVFDEVTNLQYSGHVFGWANAKTGVTIEGAQYLYDGQRYSVSGDSIYGLPVDSAFSVPASYASQIIGGQDALGDGFTYNANALPLIKGFENLDVAKAYASFFGLADGEYFDSIYTVLPLSQLEGVTWTATGGITIKGTNAVPTALGEATLTATAGKFSKTYNLVVTGLATLVGDVNGDGVIDSTDVTVLLNAILSGTTIEGGDINGDGVINTTDLTALINLILAQ